ncbi:tetratricopeptide repeat protein [Candidatus Sumerlaeota bacterium]
MPQSELISKTLTTVEQYLQDRRYNDAIQLLETVSKADSQDPSVLASLCATYMHLGMMKDARRAAKLWEKIDSGNPMVYTTMGTLCLHRNGQWYGEGFDLTKALGYLNRALELDPQNEEACQMAGLACFHHGSLDSAVHYLRLATEINPFQTQHHYWLSRAVFKMGDLETAAESLKRAVRLDQNHPQAHRFLGWIYYEQQQWDDSIKAYRQAIRVNPKDPTAYLRLGLIYGIHQRQFDKAIEFFRNLINEFPSWVPGYTGLADTYREQHKFGDAVAWYIRALQSNSAAGFPLVQLYHLFRDIGEIEILKEVADVGVTCMSRSEYDEMDYIDRARFFAVLGRGKTAHQMLNQYAKRFPAGRAISVLSDYRTLIDHPKALLQVDKSILRRIKSKLTPNELSDGKQPKRAKSAEKKSGNEESAARGFFTHEYVLLRQFDWEPTDDEREEVRALWQEFYDSYKAKGD